ncbi:hypothetical protein [Alicyclobacillus mengziensis]|uniref:Uncharacterized protein n=1 Tax=Alicyclobacillus mengziensis TaxID=2931921 RepID=A0A9X7VZ52_9BACL|nr:hypothetical protein [Alicyclobacillus mengziensis]QSO47743.1 hypothetical protein JZ786_01440 [Alicyclobacillus mengziensis]
MHTFWQMAFWAMLVASVICIPIQRRALNKIAFGRSLFITYTAILMGYIVGVLATTVAADIMGIVLYVLGMAMLLFMAVKSLQRLREKRE